MAVNMKDELKRLIDEIPDEELHVARRFLEFLRGQSKNRLWQALDAAPWDDEPFTEEDADALNESMADVKSGRIIRHDEILKRMTADD